MPSTAVRPRSAPRMGRKRSEPVPGDPATVLKAIIAEREPGLTIAEIARRTGMARPNVSRLMNGEAPYPSIQTIELVLDAVKSNLCQYQKIKKRIVSDTDSA